MKKTAAILLMIAMCLTLAPAALASAPVEIADRAGLEGVASDPYGQYVLTADIDMSGADWLPIEFFGTLDGAGHTIYNLTVTQTGELTHDTQDGNHKHYDTELAGLFSYTENAFIKDLTLLGERIDIHSSGHVFIGGIAGYGFDTEITGCTVIGRLSVYMTGQMFGAGGIVGYGSGRIENCAVDAELVTADGNKEIKSEGFLGGVIACGYPDVIGCDVKLGSWVSLDGYMHSGGLVGMHHIDDIYLTRASEVRDNRVYADMYYYEHNDDPRYYCYFDFGERLNPQMTDANNESIYFNKVKVFSELETPTHILYPEQCETPQYDAAVTEPSEGSFGFTTYTCRGCGYSYIADYAAYVPPVLVESVEVSATALTIHYLDTEKLTATVTPQDADDASYTWSSSDESVCTVDENGIITAAGRGEAIITCTTTDGGYTDQCAVTVDYTFGQWLKIILLFGWICYI